MDKPTVYTIYRRFIQTGDILLWSSNTTIGKAIQWKTKSKYNHVSTIIQINNYDRIFCTEALSNGVQLSVLSKRLESFNGSVYWLALKHDYEYFRYETGRWAMDQLGVPYDYDSLFKQLIHRVNADAKQQFCSEHSFLALKNAGIPELQEINIAPRPSDMESLGCFDNPVKIYEKQGGKNARNNTIA